jgi:hypothetical protein
MTPERFATEYPDRCLELLESFEPLAREKDLYGTFSIMLASSILLIPWERVRNKHPLTQEHGGNLQASLKELEKQKWLEADFWGSAEPGDWRFSRIMGDPNDVRDWRDDHDRPSFSRDANTIGRRKARHVFRVLRNALAHGNMLYLDADGRETPGNRVEHLAFLSRYEEDDEQKANAETYRLVTVREADFLTFVRAWGRWVADHHQLDSDLRVA